MENLKIDSEFWQLRVKKAIKKYPNRAVDIFHCFSPTQKESKVWLIKCLNEYTSNTKKIFQIAILGSWYGYLSYLLKNYFNKHMTEIRCYDVDSVAKNVGKVLFHDNKITHFVTKDISTINFQEYRYNLTINTSCEHMSDDTLHHWLFTAKKDTICVLQSTDKPARDHSNLITSEKELVEKFKEYFIDYKSYSHKIGEYSRFLLIGTKQ
tara:strand:+ start:1126 stop:1752 length:627 start_codon:yes stop_codon:yes gene_type:complete